MASWTPPVTLPAGNPLPSTDYNALANDVLFLYQRPYFAGYDAVGQSIPSGTITTIGMTGVYWSGYGMVVSAELLVVPLTGIYYVSGTVWGAAAAGTIDALINVNGNVNVVRSRASLNAGFTGVTTSGVVSLNAGNFLGLSCYQDSGTTVVMATATTTMSAFFLGAA